MYTPVEKAELFEGALIRWHDIESVPGIVTAIEADHIVLTDVYSWMEHRARYDQLFQRHIDRLMLEKLGFNLVSRSEKLHVYENDAVDCTVTFSLEDNQKTWMLLHGKSQIYPSCLHQLQRLIQALTGELLVPQKPINENETEDD